MRNVPHLTLTFLLATIVVGPLVCIGTPASCEEQSSSRSASSENPELIFKSPTKPITKPSQPEEGRTVNAVIRKYCVEFGHCKNGDPSSYGNWPNHFFALRGWLTDRAKETESERQKIEIAIMDLNDAYGGTSQFNTPAFLKTLPPPPEPYPLNNNKYPHHYDSRPFGKPTFYNSPRQIRIEELPSRLQFKSAPSAPTGNRPIKEEIGPVEGPRDLNMFQVEPTMQDERYYYDARPLRHTVAPRIDPHLIDSF